MSLKHVIDVMEWLETPQVDESSVRSFLSDRGLEDREIACQTVSGIKGKTLFLKIHISGEEGKSVQGSAPTLGIIGQLGGAGARPHQIGLVSDADGAIAALAAACKILSMRTQGDLLRGDVTVATHLCPDAPVIPHEPVPFMDSPVGLRIMNEHTLEDDMDAVLSIDATKGNRVINHRGFAISPTVKDGYILRVSEDLLDIMQNVTGRMPVVFPVTTQDITPYGNGVFHLNAIMQPSTGTHSPVVGVALTAGLAVPGCASGANQPQDLESAVRFVIETAKAFGRGQCAFYDPEEFQKLVAMYGSMENLKSGGD